MGNADRLQTGRFEIIRPSVEILVNIAHREAGVGGRVFRVYPNSLLKHFARIFYVLFRAVPVFKKVPAAQHGFVGGEGAGSFMRGTLTVRVFDPAD